MQVHPSHNGITVDHRSLRWANRPWNSFLGARVDAVGVKDCHVPFLSLSPFACERCTAASEKKVAIHCEPDERRGGRMLRKSMIRQEI
jgi:hypothetical protein